MSNSNPRKGLKRQVGLSLFSAIIVVLTVLGNFVRFGPVPITLSLAPIIIGAAVYGSSAGALLGGVFGLLLAVISIWIVLAAMQVFTPMLAADTQAQVETALRQSYLAGLVVNWNPLGIMFQ